MRWAWWCLAGVVAEGSYPEAAPALHGQRALQTGSRRPSMYSTTSTTTTAPVKEEVDDPWYVHRGSGFSMGPVILIALSTLLCVLSAVKWCRRNQRAGDGVMEDCRPTSLTVKTRVADICRREEHHRMSISLSPTSLPILPKSIFDVDGPGGPGRRGSTASTARRSSTASSAAPAKVGAPSSSPKLAPSSSPTIPSRIPDGTWKLSTKENRVPASAETSATTSPATSPIESPKSSRDLLVGRRSSYSPKSPPAVKRIPGLHGPLPVSNAAEVALPPARSTPSDVVVHLPGDPKILIPKKEGERLGIDLSSDGEFRVEGIQEGSPVLRAIAAGGRGLRRGDRILTVGGVPVADVAFAEVRHRAGPIEFVVIEPDFMLTV